MNQRDDTNTRTNEPTPAGRPRRTRKGNHVTFLTLYIDVKRIFSTHNVLYNDSIANKMHYLALNESPCGQNPAGGPFCIGPGGMPAFCCILP